MKTSDDEVGGTLELAERGGVFLRSPKHNYTVRQDDVRVPTELVKRFQLRGGEDVRGTVSQAGNKKRLPATLTQITSIGGKDPEDWCENKPFEELTVVSPDQRVRFETSGGPTSMRVVDLLTPIGLGQRGLIVAPPRTGKTVLLQQMAAGVAANHPDVYMMVLLIDERPEEVTDMRRTVHGEVVASSNDYGVTSHVRIARLMIAKAKRLVESGRDVFILLDSLTRLGRAFNAYIRGAGRIMSGGLDIRALEEPRSIFGAARNFEDGGSLTIIASILVETGSRMDDVIFNEFKGTGNMEIMLSQNMANKRIWPAIDVEQSGTRKEELLLSEEELASSHKIRRSIAGRSPEFEMQALLEQMEKHTDNAGFMASLQSR